MLSFIRNDQKMRGYRNERRKNGKQYGGEGEVEHNTLLARLYCSYCSSEMMGLRRSGLEKDTVVAGTKGEDGTRRCRIRAYGWDDVVCV